MKLWSNSLLLLRYVYVHQATYIGVITKQNFDFAIPFSCANNQQNVNGIDSKCDEHVCAHRPALKAAPERNLGIAIDPNTKTVQYALYCSNTDLKKLEMVFY